MNLYPLIVKVLPLFPDLTPINNTHNNQSLAIRNSSDGITSNTSHYIPQRALLNPQINKFMTTLERAQQLYGQSPENQAKNKRDLSDKNIIRQIYAKGMNEIRNHYPEVYKTIKKTVKQLDAMFETLSSEFDSQTGQAALGKTIKNFFGELPATELIKLENHIREAVTKFPMSLHLLMGVYAKNIAIADLDDNVVAAMEYNTLYLRPDFAKQSYQNKTSVHEVLHEKTMGFDDNFNPIGPDSAPKHSAKKVRKLMACKNHPQFARKVFNSIITPLLHTQLQLASGKTGQALMDWYCHDAQLPTRLRNIMNDANMMTDVLFHFFDRIKDLKEKELLRLIEIA